MLCKVSPVVMFPMAGYNPTRGDHPVTLRASRFKTVFLWDCEAYFFKIEKHISSRLWSIFCWDWEAYFSRLGSIFLQDCEASFCQSLWSIYISLILRSIFLQEWEAQPDVLTHWGFARWERWTPPAQCKIQNTKVGKSKVKMFPKHEGKQKQPKYFYGNKWINLDD